MFIAQKFDNVVHHLSLLLNIDIGILVY